MLPALPGEIVYPDVYSEAGSTSAAEACAAGPAPAVAGHGSPSTLTAGQQDQQGQKRALDPLEGSIEYVLPADIDVNGTDGAVETDVTSAAASNCASAGRTSSRFLNKYSNMGYNAHDMGSAYGEMRPRSSELVGTALVSGVRMADIEEQGLLKSGRGVTMVDIGCGTCRILRRLVAAAKGCKMPVTHAVGIEIEENLLTIADTLLRHPGALDTCGLTREQFTLYHADLRNFDLTVINGHFFYSFDKVFGDEINEIKERKLRHCQTLVRTVTFVDRFFRHSYWRQVGDPIPVAQHGSGSSHQAFVFEPARLQVQDLDSGKPDFVRTTRPIKSNTKRESTRRKRRWEKAKVSKAVQNFAEQPFSPRIQVQFNVC